MLARKSLKNQAGFTLTEVMIGIMILVVAIVAASNLLVGLVNTNKANLGTLQAYYLAQEGLEAVRNIRDTNWMHNKDWLGEGSVNLWGGKFDLEGDYAVSLQTQAFSQGVTSPDFPVDNVADLAVASPWLLSSGAEKVILLNGTETDFVRTIKISAYTNESGQILDDHILLESKVTWMLGSNERSVVLNEVLTNWKGGAF
ncbi:prepilin-type N-terminal cleavage/methylation domain-containing protein [Candidatus Peregrinibacteria bacterium]|nr:prepilin-type N-terminal cleavage/methylation domain-containing protein [Candidatus Peregrinibacteria bacterium]